MTQKIDIDFSPFNLLDGEITKAVKADFAVRNGAKITDLPDFSQEPGRMFSGVKAGSAKKISMLGQAITGTLEGLPYQTYSLSTGAPRPVLGPRYIFQIMAITLPHNQPHIIIDSLVDAAQAASLPSTISASQQVQLKGDINHYFKVYTATGNDAQASAILTPDLVAVLTEYAKSCDIELIDNKLYFYWPLYGETAENYKRIYTTATMVLRAIKPAVTKAAPVHDQAKNAATPTASRIRINSRGPAIAIFLVLVILAIIGAMVLRDYAFLFLIILVALIVSLIVYYVRSARLIRT